LMPAAWCTPRRCKKTNEHHTLTQAQLREAGATATIWSSPGKKVSRTPGAATLAQHFRHNSALPVVDASSGSATLYTPRLARRLAACQWQPSHAPPPSSHKPRSSGSDSTKAVRTSMRSSESALPGGLLGPSRPDARADGKAHGLLAGGLRPTSAPAG
jgi:hypothetical protein